jgi:hypothetical protein
MQYRKEHVLKVFTPNWSRLFLFRYISEIQADYQGLKSLLTVVTSAVFVGLISSDVRSESESRFYKFLSYERWFGVIKVDPVQVIRVRL